MIESPNMSAYTGMDDSTFSFLLDRSASTPVDSSAFNAWLIEQENKNRKPQYEILKLETVQHEPLIIHVINSGHIITGLDQDTRTGQRRVYVAKPGQVRTSKSIVNLQEEISRLTGIGTAELMIVSRPEGWGDGPLTQVRVPLNDGWQPPSQNSNVIPISRAA